MCEYANYVQGNSNDTVKAWTTFTCSPSGLILRQEGKIQESLEQFQVITVVISAWNEGYPNVPAQRFNNQGEGP